MLNIDEETLARIVDDAVKAEWEACAEIAHAEGERCHRLSEVAPKNSGRLLNEERALVAWRIADEIKARGGS